ncbi:MAG: prepilin-type N-terminal cleavage/methylation domain-containing protein [Opitutales bacterium]|nr:prepilin-type N-terminal cleavage/methylation domain-containing protein [Opitutales bacterium]
MRSTSGLTLVEVMVGLVLASLLAAGAFASMRVGYGVIDSARDTTRVSQIMQAEIERLRVMPWSRLNELPEQSDFMKDSEYDGVFEKAFPGRYRGERIVRKRMGRDDQLEVRVAVMWEANGRSHRQAYRTFFTREGLNDYYQRRIND